MSIFSYGYIGMNISEMMTSEVSEILEIRYIQISDISNPMCPFLAMDISEMDILEMTSSKHIGIQICSFRICPFYDKPPFLPDPEISLSKTYCKFV
jgi:hypothetical protein